MTRSVDLALGFVDRCSEHTDVELLLSDFRELVEATGFKHFLMTGLPGYGEDVETLIVANHWPEEWTHHYRENGFFMDDPVSLWSFSSSKPFTWSEAREGSAPTKRAEMIESDANAFGMVDGVGFPMFDPQNWQAVVSLAADTPVALSRKETAAIYLASVMAQTQAVDLSNKDQPKKAALSGRERDVLTWIAHGKSNWETATILGISEATVRAHLSSARTKLGASNTTQAVARGIGSRQIRL